MSAPVAQNKIDSDDAGREVLDAVRHIVRMLRVSSRASEKAVGLTAAQLFVLYKLADGAATSLNELAQRTLTDQSSVSVVVTRLVERKLVSRSRSGADARRIELSLTARGRAVLRKAPHPAQDLMLAALRRMGVAKRKGLAAALTELIGQMGLEGSPPLLSFEEESAGKPKPAARKSARSAGASRTSRLHATLSAGDA